MLKALLYFERIRRGGEGDKTVKDKIAQVVGRIQTLSGGSRTQVKLNRPWQLDLNNDPLGCAFCEQDQEKWPGTNYSLQKIDWIVLDDQFTPPAFHKLIIPVDHLPNERLRILGGEQMIASALEIANKELCRAPEKYFYFSLTINIGYCAGQTVNHLHWHLHELIQNSPTGRVTKIKPSTRPELQIIKSDSLLVAAGGYSGRTGIYRTARRGG